MGETHFLNNFCKLYFATITFSIIILSVLINLCESRLPLAISRMFRYGKTSVNSGPKFLNLFEVPKSYFRHFYLTSALYFPVIYFEIISVYLFGNKVSPWFQNVLDFCCGQHRIATVSATRTFIAATLLLLQVYRRCYDTFFVSVFSQNAKINLSHYFIGMTYYPAVMLTLLSEAPGFTGGTTEGVKISDVGLLDLGVICAFLWAWYHQHVATVILAKLRTNNKGQVVSQQYKLPQGDWFRYLSSPHSTAEILMYSSLAVLLKGHTGYVFVIVWVLANQIEMILLSHWWYKAKFENFPPQRKALIPLIY